MRVFVTGGTGFVGMSLVREMLERGDAPVVLVRDPGKGALLPAGCELVHGSLADESLLEEAIAGCEAAIHNAAIYEIGAAAARRREMYRTNVLGTIAMAEAALRAGVPRFVHVSTVTALGNSHGVRADETFGHKGSFPSYYERTKAQAHGVIRRAIARGLPATIVLPAPVYGPGDHSTVGWLIENTARRRVPMLPFATAGVSLVHVDDVAAGIVAALRRGRPGEQYVLAGESVTIRELADVVADTVGVRAPRLSLPRALTRLTARPFSPLAGVFGLPPNLAETVRATEGYTYWASSAKAQAELGWRPRPLRAGIEATLQQTA